MSKILDQILATQRDHLLKAKRKTFSSDLRSFPLFEKECLSLGNALQKEQNRVAVIAEFKRASPSRGDIFADANVQKVTDQYIEQGANALSILTNEPYFKGSNADIEKIAANCPIPILRKEFIIDPWQVTESKAIGADAILLIMAALDGVLLDELLHAASEEGLEVLLECDLPEHVDRLEDLKERVQIVGVNNRDLRNFTIDSQSGLELLQRVPDSFIRVSESGHSSPKDLQEIYEAGIDAVLIGTTFMKSVNPGEELKKIRMSTTNLENSSQNEGPLGSSSNLSSGAHV